MSRATKPYRKAEPTKTWDVAPAEGSGASLSVVEEDEAVLLLTIHGQMRLGHDAEPALWRILDEHAELDKLVKPRLGKVTIKEQTLTLTQSRWGQLHRGLLLTAGLAWEGKVNVSCAEWDSCINAVGDPPPAQPRRSKTSEFPTTRRRERPGKR